MNSKICTKCNQEKSLDLFHKDRSKRDGTLSQCKECTKKRARDYNKANPDKQRARKLKWIEKNFENYEEYLAATRAHNHERFSDPELRERDRQTCKAYYQTPRGRFNKYRAGARERNLAFNLTFDQFLMFWDSRCDYCGLEIVGIGIDRIDNSLGYSVENCVPCCPSCNSLKLTLSRDEFIKQCERITLYRLKKFVAKNGCKQPTMEA